MKKNTVAFKAITVLAATSIFLGACSDGEKKPAATKPPEKVDTSTFPLVVKNDKEDVAGGVLKYGLVSNTPFEGILNNVVYEGAPDSEVIQFFDEALLGTDTSYVYDDSGAATYEVSEDKRTITLTIRDNVNWHDGKPVTGADLEYAYEIIGNKKYKGVRYDSQMKLIEGMEEYRAGKAKKISGIKADGKVVSITFKEANPSVLTGLWTSPVHKEYMKDVPIDKFAESDKVRKNVIGFGPFKVKSITPGEAVEYVANEDYWKGKPKLDGVLLKVVNPQIATASLEKGDIDVIGVTADQYDQAKALKNVQILGKMGLAYTYIGFKLGHYDVENSKTIMDKPKFQDKRLRQAMAYALDNKTVGEKFYKGLRIPANSVIPPSHPKYNDKNLEGYTYDPEKSKALLKEAGYVDTNGDGLVEDPDGKEFKVNFASMSGDDIAEPLAKYYVQAWNEIGVDVQLMEGRLHEFNSFYDMLEKDNEKIDIYQGAWSVGSDPDPSGIWASDAAFNYTRWVNADSDQLLQDAISPKAFDEAYRVEKYNEWQALIKEEAPLIPTLFRYSLSAVNNRVKGWEITNGWDDLEKVSLTAEESEK